MYRIIGSDGKQYGPISAEQLRQWLDEGRADAQTQVQIEGETSWRPLSSFPEFSSSAVTGQPPVPPPLTGTRPPGQRVSTATSRVPNYLVPSILVTLFCCLPLGIPAIVFAAQVNSKEAAGDIQGARDSSKKAKTWCWVSFGVGLAVCVIYVLIFIIAAVAESVR